MQKLDGNVFYKHFGSDCIYLPRAESPGAAGVSSQAFCDFVAELEKSGVMYHSLMVIRGDRVACEMFKFPYNKYTPHCMYSMSKNVTATALGFAVSEGLLSLDMEIKGFFPEYKKLHHLVRGITIRHLVTMTAGKAPSYLLNKTQRDWIKQFFNAPQVTPPGKKFRYTNENSYMLCEIIRRVTGESVNDYLEPRLWQPLGIKKPYWETAPNGTESGGWGIFLTAESLAKLFICYKNGGVFAGQQVIPRKWAENAVLSQALTRSPKREKGYGFSFWRSGEASFKGEGIFGQVARVLEDKNALIIMTGADNELKPFWMALKAFEEKGFIAEGTENETLCLPDLREDSIPYTGIRSPLESSLSSRILTMPRDFLSNLVGFPMSAVPIPATYMTKDRAGNMDMLHLEFFADYCRFSWREGDEYASVKCSMKGDYAYTPVRLGSHDYLMCAAAFWRDNYTLELWLRPLESIAKRTLTLSFSGGEIRVKVGTSPTVKRLIHGIFSEFRMNAQAPLCRFLTRQGEKLLEPEYKIKL